jgi:SAM-dependent methyltransferase
VASRDAVVVGGGIVGCATAYFLARAGASVTLLEREHVAYGASGRNPGFIWLHTRKPGFALDAALAGRRLYDELVEELDPFDFRAAGGLVFFLTPEQGAVIEEFARARSADGLEMHMIDGAEVRRLVPPIREDVVGASYCPLDAHMNTPLFVRALADAARRHGADVREGVAEELPWPDGSFDAALSSLVIGFMRDADRGVREMERVTRPGGTVAACMWDIATGGMTMLTTFWSAVREIVPSAEGERRLAGTSAGDIADRFRRAGLADVEDGALTAHADYAGFDDFWEPFTYAVGPAGQYLRSLPEEQRARVRDACRARLPDGPFTLDARAWYAVGRAG